MNWDNINKDYSNETDKLIYITKQYLEYITVERQKYYDNLITPEYIINKKNEALQILISI